MKHIAVIGRGPRLTGLDATLEFDWITGDYTVFSHRDKQIAQYHMDDSGRYRRHNLFGYAAQSYMSADIIALYCNWTKGHRIGR